MTENNSKEKKHRKQNKNSDIVLVTDVLPDRLKILPIIQRPVFPGILIPLTFSGKYFAKTLKSVFEKESRLIGIVLIKERNKKDLIESYLYDVGTVVKIFKFNQIDENTTQIVVQGLQRFKKVRESWEDDIISWKVKYHYDDLNTKTEILRAYTLSIMSSLKEMLKLNPILQEQIKMMVSQISHDNPALIIDIVASILNSPVEKLQQLLETFDLIKRSERLLILLKEEIELAKIQEDIEKQIEEKVSKQQKDFFLREQLKVIKKELGVEKDDKSAEIEKLEKRLERLKLSEEASKVIEEEMDKLKMLEPISPEYNVTRSYLNVLTELPWGIYSQDRLAIKEVRKILDEDHYGLDDVKKTILEFIGTIMKRGSVAGSILCLVGPPGVGKTSVGRSIARALGREFYRFSLGGMRDEAEIKGHRRTYIGAMPGKILQSLKRTGTANPVIMLDEIDKIGKSFMGDPASALLEVLDPEQNKDFLDHYLDVRFDLSKILFITTANQLDTIPRPLLDRMEVIKLSGYILEEKVQIAKKFLIPRQLKAHGLLNKEIKITDKALNIIADQYSREAGVRNFENYIKKIMRQVTLKQAEGKKKKFSISSRNLTEYIGNPVFTGERLYPKPLPGVALGLAWTALGGTTLYIEASAVKINSAGFKQTGQLGKVMQESAEIAYSYIRSYLSSNQKYMEFFKTNYFHLHVPAGATPKDGPSAGITMALAIYSLATNQPIRNNIAMTGELTLTGKVLPIGGIKEKSLAAKRLGIKEIILPLDNQRDFEELPAHIKDGLKIHFVDYFNDVLKAVFA